LLLERLSRLEGATHAVISEAIDEFYEHRTADDPPPRLVGPIREAIDSAFSSRNPVTIMEKLQALTSGGGKQAGVNPSVEAWAKETVDALQARSPTSVCVTREALCLAREKTLKGAFETEMRLAQAYCVSAPCLHPLVAFAIGDCILILY
jgi:3-hydroxyisobutyryl-CoA hydrolase